MRTSEFMDKEIAGLNRSRSDDFSSFGISRDDYDDEDGLSPRFGFYSSNPQSSACKGKVNSSFEVALLSLINKRMKEHTDEVLHAVEGVSARLTQLETRARKMENAIDDVKESLNSCHGRTDGKLRELENLLREVQSCTRDIRDKQEIAEAQIQLQKLAMSKDELDKKMPETTTRPESVRELPPSVVPQQSIQSFPIPVAPSQQTSTYPPQIPSHLPIPQPPPQLLPPGLLTPSKPEPHHQIPPVPHPNSTPLQPQQFPYQLQPVPPVPIHQLHQPPYIAAVPPATHQASSSVQLQLNDFSHYTPHISEKSTHVPFTSPFHGPPFQQQFDSPYSKPPEHTKDRPYSHFPSYQPEGSNFNNLYDPGRGGAFHPKPPSMSSGSPSMSSGYSQLPTARVLQEALPTVSIKDPELSSDRNSNKEPIDEVVGGVVAMGFRRDVVRATVKRLTDRGQPVDLNAVLDMLTNEAQNQTQSARFR